MQCVKCNKQIDDNAKICDYCGAPQYLDGGNNQQRRFHMPFTRRTINMDNYYNQDPAPKKDNKILIAIIATVLVIIALIIAIVVIKNGGSDNSENEQYNTNTNYNKQNTGDEISGNTKYIGNSEIGYIKVPTDWVPFSDVNAPDAFQYSDPKSKYIVSLSAVKTTQIDALTWFNNVKDYLEKQGELTNIKAGATKLSVYDAYQLYGYYDKDGMVLVVWTFDTPNGYTHYISLEGDLAINDYSYIPESFVTER